MATTEAEVDSHQTEIAPGVAFPPLSGKRVHLRPVLQSDYDFLYRLFTAEDHTFLWRFRGAAPGPEAFLQMLWQNVLCQFIVSDQRTGDPVGLMALRI